MSGPCTSQVGILGLGGGLTEVGLTWDHPSLGAPLVVFHPRSYSCGEQKKKKEFSSDSGAPNRENNTFKAQRSSLDAITY